MVQLVITLKNGKCVTSEVCPLIQAILWRSKLSDRQTVQVPTKNGTYRIDGKTVLSATVDPGHSLTTSEAAACMLVEPFAHYRNEHGDTYQFSRISGEYERAAKRMHAIHWIPAALPESTWVRTGIDTLLHI